MFYDLMTLVTIAICVVHVAELIIHKKRNPWLETMQVAAVVTCIFLALVYEQNPGPWIPTLTSTVCFFAHGSMQNQQLTKKV